MTYVAVLLPFVERPAWRTKAPELSWQGQDSGDKKAFQLAALWPKSQDGGVSAIAVISSPKMR